MSLTWSALHGRLLAQSITPSFARGYQYLRRQHPPLANLSEPAAVLDLLHGDVASADARNDILCALVSAAQEEGAASDCALTLALLALWPGLDAIHGRLRRHYRDAPDPLLSDLLAGITGQIRSARLEHITRIAATLLRNTERDIRRRLQRRWDESACSEPFNEATDHDLATADWFQSTANDPDVDVLACLRALPRADADLVMAVVILGFSQKEAADRLGLSHDAARKRYQRALNKLRAHLSQ